MKYRVEWTETTDHIPWSREHGKPSERVVQHLEERWMVVECDSVETAERLARGHMEGLNRRGDRTASYPSIIPLTAASGTGTVSVELERLLRWDKAFAESDWGIA